MKNIIPEDEDEETASVPASCLQCKVLPKADIAPLTSLEKLVEKMEDESLLHELFELSPASESLQSLGMEIFSPIAGNFHFVSRTQLLPG